jgi:hypothetical protein
VDKGDAGLVARFGGANDRRCAYGGGSDTRIPLLTFAALEGESHRRDANDDDPDGRAPDVSAETPPER